MTSLLDRLEPLLQEDQQAAQVIQEVLAEQQRTTEAAAARLRETLSEYE
jgi:galactokinase